MDKWTFNIRVHALENHVLLLYNKVSEFKRRDRRAKGGDFSSCFCKLFST